MRKFWIAAVALSGLMLSGAALKAEDTKDAKKDDKGWTGILIDKACGEKDTMEKAAKHPKSCAMKEACAKSGYGIITKDDKFVMLDDKGQEAAKKYLEDEKHGTKVHVTGKLSDDGKTIAVDKIHASKAEKKDSDEKKESK